MRRLLAAASLVTLAACDLPTDPAAEAAGIALPIDLGTQVLTRDNIWELRWAASGTLFLESTFAPSGSRIEAVQLNPSHTDVVAISSTDQFDYLWPSASGAVVYVVSSALRSETRTAFALTVSDGSARTLTSSPGYGLGNANMEGYPLVPSPDDARVASVALPDSLSIWTLATGQLRTLTTGCNGVVAWSPSGDKILCAVRTGGDPYLAYALVSVADGSSQALALPPDVQRFAKSFQWDAQGIHVLSLPYAAVWMYDVTAQRTTIIQAAPTSLDGAYPDYEHSTWSRDGTRFAFWTTQCLGGVTLTTCTAPQSVLWIYDLPSRALRRTAVAGAGRLGDVVLSADGSRVAFVIGTSLTSYVLYVKAVPVQ